MFSLAIKIAVGAGLFSMVPAEAINSMTPGLTDYHQTAVQYMTPAVDFIKSFLSGN